ncbi:MAG: hypothetical protein Q8P60_12100 [Pseudorhodobacter sp.]|nr:hypothetical protein [Pseudorhodobacter sp.]
MQNITAGRGGSVCLNRFRAVVSVGASSKMNAEWAFLAHLRDLGRETATAWLDRHYDAVGQRGTIDLRAMFQGIGPQHQG